jgi:hypothetical protein
MTKKEFREGNGIVARQAVLVVAAALTLAASAAVHTFTNSFGYWSDSSNWDTGIVPNGPGETAVLKGGYVTNDVDGLTLVKITNPSAETRLYGKPVTLAGNIISSVKNLHFYCPVFATNGIAKQEASSVYFYSTNSFPSYSVDSGHAGHLQLYVQDPVLPVTNWSVAPFKFTDESSATPGAMLFGTAASRPVQELSVLDLKRGMVTFQADAYSTWRVGEANVNGHVRVTNDGRFEVVDSRSSTGSWRIDGPATLCFAAPDANLRPTSGAAVHLDASRADLFEYLDGDPANGVVRWNGVNGRGYAYHDLQQASDGTRVMPMRVENVANGLAVVDFGDTYNKSYSPATERAKGGYLILDKGSGTDYRPWTIFIVECCQNFVWGAYNASGIMHGTDSWNGKMAVNRNETHSDFRDGSALVRLNGATVDPFSANLSGKGNYDVIGVRMANSATYMGRLAWDRSYRTGAARIGEVLIYTRKLTDEEFAMTEAYLLKKWKGVDAAAPVMPDHAADAVHFSSATARPVEVEDGAAVEVESIGGTLSGGITGDGRLLAKRGMTAQMKPFTVDGATLALSSAGGEAFAAPAADPVENTFFHLDATASDTFTLGPCGEVLEWRDVDYASTGRAAYSPNDAENPPPRFVQSVLNGKPGVDSGAAGSGKVLLWNHTNTTIRCVFLVYAQPAGDNLEFLVGDTYRNNVANFHRGQNGEMFYSGGYVASGITSSGADVRVNGAKVPNVLGKYLTATEPVVVAINLAEGTTASAAAFFVDRWNHPSNGKKFRSGAQKLCEAIFYDRRLDTAEFEAVQNHLIAKWLPSTPPSYNLPAGEEPFGELKSLGENSKIEVTAGDTVEVGTLLGGDWTKVGGGTLVANGLSTAGALSVEEGELRIGARALPSGWAPPRAAFRVDASDASTFTLEGDAVMSVRDADGGTMFAFAPTNNGVVLAPRRVERADIPGGWALDFGEFGTSSGTYGNCLLWNTNDLTVRTVFLVVSGERGFGMPLGTMRSSDGQDFYRYPGTSISPAWVGDTAENVRAGRTFVDGVEITNSDSFREGWQVVSIQTMGNVKASAFAADRYEGCATSFGWLTRMGGVVLAEAIIYDAPLTAQMRRDIEAHLMRKWLGTAPAGFAGGTSRVGSLGSMGGSLTAEEGVGALELDSLGGTNDVTLALDAPVSVRDLSAFEGTLHASSGSVSITGVVRPDEAHVPTDGLIAHFDMAATNLLETYEENGTNFVTKWYDRSGQRYAVADPTNRPWIVKNDCNGLDVLCTGPFCQSGQPTLAKLPQAGWLIWDNPDCKAKTVIEVIGLQEGGNFLVCCRPSLPCMHRGGYTGLSYTDSILAGNRSEPGNSLYSADAFFSINGNRVPYSQGFPSASYHTFAARVDETKDPGYFYIGQFGKERWYRWGGQRVCEVLAYSRCLTDDELGRLEAYLQAKWFGRAYRDYVTAGMGSVEVAAPTVLDLGGERRVATNVSGNGVISNGTLCVEGTLSPSGLTVKGGLELADGAVLAVDLGGGGTPLTVEGPVSIGAAGTLSIVVPSRPAGEWTLFTAESVTGGMGAWTLNVTPHLPAGFGWRIYFADGALKIRFLNPGSVLIFK